MRSLANGMHDGAFAHARHSAGQSALTLLYSGALQPSRL